MFVLIVTLACAVVVGLVVAVVRRLVKPHHRRIASLWVIAPALSLGTIVAIPAALSQRQSMANGSACVLQALDFENDSAEQLTTDWWPPAVQCFYGYSSRNAHDVVWESRWWILSPFGLIPGSMYVIALLVRATRRNGTASPVTNPFAI